MILWGDADEILPPRTARPQFASRACPTRTSALRRRLHPRASPRTGPPTAMTPALRGWESSGRRCRGRATPGKFARPPRLFTRAGARGTRVAVRPPAGTTTLNGGSSCRTSESARRRRHRTITPDAAPSLHTPPRSPCAAGPVLGAGAGAGVAGRRRPLRRGSPAPALLRPGWPAGCRRPAAGMFLPRSAPTASRSPASLRRRPFLASSVSARTPPSACQRSGTPCCPTRRAGARAGRAPSSDTKSGTVSGAPGAPGTASTCFARCVPQEISTTVGSPGVRVLGEA